MKINNLTDPYVKKEDLIETYRSINEHNNKDMNVLFENVAEILNNISNEYIDKILSHIKRSSLCYEINLVEKIRKSFKNKICKKTKLESYKCQSINTKNELTQVKKEERTKIYSRFNKNIKQIGYKKTYEVYDPDIYLIKVNDEDMTKIYSILECENSLNNEEFISNNLDQNEKEKLNKNPFTLESILTQRKQEAKPINKKELKQKSIRRLDYYLTTVNDCLEDKNNLMRQELKKTKTSCYEYKNSNHTISKFPWNQTEKIKSFYSDILKDKSIIKYVKWTMFESNKDEDSCEIQQIAAERIYGSSPEMFTEMYCDKEENLNLSQYLTERAQTIFYLMKYGKIKCSKNGAFTKKLLGFVHDIYTDNKTELKGDHLAGEQTGPLFSKLHINKFPFEAIFRINNTLGRLMVLYRTEELTSLSKFPQNSCLAKVFGIVKRIGFDYEELEREQDDKTLCWSKEKKIQIVARLRIKMKKLYSKLFPALAYKYLVEEEVRECQVKGDKFEHITHESESSLFQCYVGYMYYLSHLKREDFNPEIYLRSKLFCDCKARFQDKFKAKLGCICVYGIQLNQIKAIVKNLNHKSKLIKDNLESSCIYSEQSRKYIVKKECRNFVLEEYKGVENINLLQRNLEAVFDHKIDLSFLEADQ